MITESDAKNFILTYEKETGEKISLAESFEILESLVEMVRLVYKPIKNPDYKPCTKNKSTT